MQNKCHTKILRLIAMLLSIVLMCTSYADPNENGVVSSRITCKRPVSLFNLIIEDRVGGTERYKIYLPVSLGGKIQEMCKTYWYKREKEFRRALISYEGNIIHVSLSLLVTDVRWYLFGEIINQNLVIGEIFNDSANGIRSSIGTFRIERQV